MAEVTVSKRVDYLDAVRAFALLLGVVFHAGLSFMPVFIGWAVMDVSTSEMVAAFTLVSHSFRMPLFFLIAGFFSRMTVHRKGARLFLKSRAVRIALPFVVGWFVLRPLIVSGWIMGGESLRGTVDIIGALETGFATLGDLPEWFLIGTHLWFLYYLLLATASMLVFRFALNRHQSLALTITDVLDRTLRWLCASRFGLIALALPTAVGLWFMNHWGLDTPDQSLRPHWPAYLIYTGFFGFGWWLNRRPVMLIEVGRLHWSVVVVAALATGSALSLSAFESMPGMANYALYRAGFVLAYAIMMWALISLTLGVFRRWFDRPNPAVRYVADASYWLYLIHLPLVVWLQVLVAEWSLPWWLKWPGVFAATVAIALLLYELLVRSTFVGWVLNGKRRPFRWRRGTRIAKAQ